MHFPLAAWSGLGSFHFGCRRTPRALVRLGAKRGASPWLGYGETKGSGGIASPLDLNGLPEGYSRSPYCAPREWHRTPRPVNPFGAFLFKRSRCSGRRPRSLRVTWTALLCSAQSDLEGLSRRSR
jgi:hypothetical protein